MNAGLPPYRGLTAAVEGFFTVRPAEVAILVAGVALVFAIRRWRGNVLRAQKRAKKEEGVVNAAKSAGTENALSMRDVTVQVQALLAEVEETARRAAAQIENRRVRLEQVIAEADEKIRQLEELVGKVESGAAGVPARTRGAGLLPPTTTSAAGAAGKGGAVPAVVQVSREATQALNRLRQERGAPPAQEDPAYRPIYELADQGKSSREIGQALGRQPGEIELILALRGKQRKE